jgi:hypothetical protein
LNADFIIAGFLLIPHIFNVILVFFVNRGQLTVVFRILLFSGVFLRMFIFSVACGIRNRLEFFKDILVLGGAFGC